MRLSGHMLGSFVRFFRRAFVDEELDEEMRFHVDQATEEGIEQGLSRNEARRRALLQFGSVERAKQESREVMSLYWLRSTIDDLRFSLRSLLRSPAFLFATLLTLGVAVSTTAIIAAALRQVFFLPLPHDAPEQVITIWETHVEQENAVLEVSPGNYFEWHSRSDSFDSIGLAEPTGVELILGGRPKAVSGWNVSEDFVDALKIEPILGRSFRTEEYAEQQPAVAMISDELWQREFSGDEGLVGRNVDIDGEVVEIIGILPRGIGFPSHRGLWLPWIPAPYHATIRQGNWMIVAGRLKAGVAIEQAQSELQQISANLAREYPDTNAGTGVFARPLRAQILLGIDRALFALSLAAVFFFLAACATVTSMYVTRLRARAPELAVRGAIGASPAVLARSVASELAVISAMAIVVSLVLVAPYLSAIKAAVPAQLPTLAYLSNDGFLSLAIVILALAMAFGCGIWPATRIVNMSLPQNLRDSGRVTLERARAKVRNVLIIAQVAVATMLLIGASLMVQSLGNLFANDIGFEAENRLSLQIFSGAETGAEVNAFFEQFISELNLQPDIQAAAAVSALPFHPTQIDPRGQFEIVDRVVADNEGRLVAHALAATPGYFELMSIPLAAGRSFSEYDRVGNKRVALINETMARRFWKDGSPIGQRVRIGIMGPPQEWDVVGVVGDVRPHGYESTPRAEFYVPQAQSGIRGMTIVVSTQRDFDDVTKNIEALLWEKWPSQSIYHVASVTSLIDNSTATRTFAILVLSGFTLGAILLALLGIYSLVNYSVTLRRHEIGIRMAIGAKPVNIRRMILFQGLRLTATGILIGAACAALLSPALEALLYELRPIEPTIYVAAGLVMLVTAAIAAWVPAARAARANPTVLLGAR